MDSKRIIIVGGHHPFDTRTLDAFAYEGRPRPLIGSEGLYSSPGPKGTPGVPGVFIEDYELADAPVWEGDCKNPKCKNDHGERANRKLRDQPFYLRERNGKMRRY